MKIRSGFVSNSSTSSFILVGCLMENLDLSEKEQEKINNEEFDPIKIHGDGELLGVDICGWSDEDGIEEINLEDLTSKIKVTKAQFKKFFEEIGKPVPEIKLYGGIRAG